MEVKKVKFQHFRVRPDSDQKKGEPKHIELYSQKDGRFIMPFDEDPCPRGGATVCYIQLGDGVVVAGKAMCSMSDHFCYRTGREISFRRAYNVLDASARVALDRMNLPWAVLA